MAIGFIPKYSQEYKLESLDNEHFLVYALDAAKVLNWTVSVICETGIIAHTKLSISSYGEEVSIVIENGVAVIKSECTSTQFVDLGKNKANIKEFMAMFEKLKSSLTPEDLLSKVTLLKDQFTSVDENTLNKNPFSTRAKILNFFSIFIPTKGYTVSPILININILIFIAMIISGVHVFLPLNQDLIQWGANFKPVTLSGEWWRLLTSCFLHIGILHLLLNMYALLYIGVILEPYIGKVRFFSAYILAGVAASLTSLWWNDFTISAGASGAIFGMYGLFLALLTTNLLDKSVKNSFLLSSVVFILYNIVFGLKPDSGIDNAAHIGGLVSGIIIGYMYVPSLKENHDSVTKYSIIGILSFILFITSYIIYTTTPNDLVTYEKKMKEFAAVESMALEVYNLPQEMPKEYILKELNDRGLYYWKENLSLVKSLDDLKLPPVYIARNKKLIKYCELRIKSYELIYKIVNEETEKYNDELVRYSSEIESIIKELSEK